MVGDVTRHMRIGQLQDLLERDLWQEEGLARLDDSLPDAGGRRLSWPPESGQATLEVVDHLGGAGVGHHDQRSAWILVQEGGDPRSRSHVAEGAGDDLEDGAGFEAGVGQLSKHLAHDVIAGTPARQPAAREQMTDVRHARHDACHLSGRFELRHRVDLEPDVAAVRAGCLRQHASDGLKALQRRGDRMHGYRSLGSFENQPLGILGV